jgi:hypothetical protein
MGDKEIGVPLAPRGEKNRQFNGVVRSMLWRSE